MIPKRVELENFLSFGCPAVEIAFADDEPLWVVGGPNGVGKSAVFDAITYCLFGCHRGGKQDADQLVKHGANGFRVTFEFEFNGVVYRVTRGRAGKRTTQRVERKRADGTGWDSEPGVNSAADVKTWAERMLGLQFEQFTASVLLRQGEADAIITATGAKRLEILKQIIGTDRFERLSRQVHEAAKRCKDKLNDRKTQLDGQPDVPAEAVTDAETRLTQAETERADANRQATEAAQRVTEAKQFGDLTDKLNRVNAAIRAADERAADADRIRADHVRLNELTAAVPLLRQIIDLRDGIENARRQVADWQSEADRVAAALRALDLAKEISEAEQFLKAVDDVAAFPADLDDRVEATRTTAKMKADAATSTGNAKAAADARRTDARKRQKDFAKVEVGVKCSRCGQEVTAEHARKERAEIDRLVTHLDAEYATAVAVEKAATAEKAQAESDLNELLNHQVRHQKAINRLIELTRTRTEHEASTDGAELRRTLPDRHQARKQAEADAGDQAGADRKALLKRQADVAAKLDAARTALATDETTRRVLTGQLAADWRPKLDRLDAAAVNALDRERQGYVTADVAGRFQQLERDADRRLEWCGQRDEYEREIAAVPEPSRVSVAEAERSAKAARTAADEADRKRDLAAKEHDRLAREADTRRALVAEVAAAERGHRLHAKLDELLGKDGLQRELVRSAEREIVRLADDTIRHLSDGDLTVELADDPADGDAAFALRVRRADDPDPIGVAYLSGSQKFRVAVAVALAIGQYATGQARRLESVIIDEGFGSLDRDGLAAMADELNRLKQYLRRIVLVSHQEEFAERFRAVIRLSRSESGTMAEAIRQ